MSDKFELSEKLEAELSAIANDNISGASLLFHRILHLFPAIAEELQATECDTATFLAALSEKIYWLRPCMAPFAQLAFFLEHMAANEFDLPVVRSVFSALPHSYVRKLKKEKQRIVDFALKAFRKHRKIMVHSRSSIVESFLFSWLKADPDREVWITESRPMCEGTMLAKALSALPNRKVLLVDDARGIALEHVDAVLIGADAVSETVLINKIGSRALAFLSREVKRPLYVVAERIKFLPDNLVMSAEQQHAGAEIGSKLKNVEYFNYYFEHVPIKMIHRIITASGVYSRAKIVEIFQSGQWNAFVIERAEVR